LTRSARTAFSVVGTPLLVLSVVASFVGFALIRPDEPYLLLIVLLIPLAALAAVKVWERPVLGVATALALIAVPWRTGGEGAAFAHLTLPDLAAAALAVIVAVRTLALGDQGRLRSWVILPLVGILIAGSAATLTANDPFTSASGLVRYAEIFVVIPAVTYLALQNTRDLKLILAVVVALGVFEGALGVYQFFTATGASYGETNIRAVGTFGAYNILALAHVVTYALIVATATFVSLRGSRRLGALLLMLALVLALVFSLSRGAWIAAAVGVVVVLALVDWQKAVLFVLVGGLALTVAFGVASDGPNVVSDRFASLYSASYAPDQSTQDRYAMWQAARSMWEEHPLTGVGLKNFPHFRDLQAPLNFSGGSDIADPSGGFRRVELLSPHSLYWLILAEQGLLGALAYGMLFLSLGLAGLRRLRDMKVSPPVQRIFFLSSLGFLASFLTSSIYGEVGGSTAVLTSVFLGGLVWLASGAALNEETS
jgi:O-antigen ligase